MTNLLFRRLTYTAFIIAFLVLTPLVVLYTQGYRYNFQRGRIQKTGILIISSVPRKADIYINEKLTDQTPTRIEKILPGDYKIKLTKDGYHDWLKTLPITDNGTTFAEKVILWKKSLPYNIDQKRASVWLATPDRKKAFFSNNAGAMALLNLENGKIIDLEPLLGYQTIKALGWSNTSKKLILAAYPTHEVMPDYFLINADRDLPTMTLLDQKFLPAQTNKIKWDEASDNIIYSLSATGVWQTELFERKYKSVLVAENIEDFSVSGNNIYFTQNGQLFQQTKGRPLEKLALAVETGGGAQVINLSRYQFVGRMTDRIILLNQPDQQLVIYNPEKNEVIKTTAKNIEMLNEKSLLFYNDWEIWLYDNEKSDPELVSRFGDQIQKALWHPLGKHIIFVANNHLKIIELDNRELRNIISLAELSFTDDININNSGDDIYLSGAISSDSGIFKLNLR